MEKQKSAGEKSVYTGRFGEQPPRKTAREAAPQHTASAPRRPSGFSAAAPANRGQAGAKKNAEATTSEKKNTRPKKESKRRQPRQKKKLGCLKPLLALLAAALIVWLCLALIFGGRNKTIHQLPTIERESIASFEPNQTPLPGAEGS